MNGCSSIHFLICCLDVGFGPGQENDQDLFKLNACALGLQVHGVHKVVEWNWAVSWAIAFVDHVALTRLVVFNGLAQAHNASKESQSGLLNHMPFEAVLSR